MRVLRVVGVGVILTGLTGLLWALLLVSWEAFVRWIALSAEGPELLVLVLLVALMVACNVARAIVRWLERL